MVFRPVFRRNLEAGAIGAGATATVALQRAVGRVSVCFADDHGRTRLRRLFQECQMKARLPRIHATSR